MAVIEIPARSIVGEPKLNIANDNFYESVGYTKQSTSFNYKELGTYSLNIINVDGSNISNANSSKVLWSSVLATSRNPYILKQDNIDKNIKVYEWNNGEYANKLLPTMLGDWHYFVVRIVIPKPDINFDYSKTTFGVWQDFRYLKPTLSGSTVVFDKYVYSEFGGVSEIPIVEIPQSRIFDKNATESELLNAISVAPDLSQINQSNGSIARQMVSLRITDTDLEFYVTNGVVNGKVSPDELYAIYSPQTFKFYYKNIERTSLGDVNENSKYSLPDNELLAEQTTYDGTSIYNQINNSVVGDYGNGKFSIDLSCLYMPYNAVEGQKQIYSGEDGNMISVGDLIIPTSQHQNNLPLAKNLTLSGKPYITNKNGVPSVFKVIKTEIETTDSKYIVNNIRAVEYSNGVYVQVHNPSENDLNIFLNGVQVKWQDTNNIFTAEIGDIITFSSSIENAHLNISSIAGQTSWLVSVAENPKIAVIDEWLTIMLVLPTN